MLLSATPWISCCTCLQTSLNFFIFWLILLEVSTSMGKTNNAIQQLETGRLYRWHYKSDDNVSRLVCREIQFHQNLRRVLLFCVGVKALTLLLLQCPGVRHIWSNGSFVNVDRSQNYLMKDLWGMCYRYDKTARQRQLNQNLLVKVSCIRQAKIYPGFIHSSIYNIISVINIIMSATDIEF